MNWFHQSPAGYRRGHRPDVLRDNEIDPVPNDTARELIRDHRRLVAALGGGPRLRMTPLLLKNLGSRKDLLDAVAEPGPALPTTTGGGTSPAVPHLVPIRVAMADLDAGCLIDGLASFDQIHAVSCLVLEYSTKSAVLVPLAGIAERLSNTTSPKPAIWLIYGTIHDRSGVERVAISARDDWGPELQPILTP